ncbi:MAG: hypothetical protein H6737_31615 [Alphaproteobacteria bacterium]|nr:hypothetical protein [Alphaproteobacteria bacterium]
MRLPSSVRDALLEELDSYIDAVDEPEVETVITYILDQLQLAEDDWNLEDIAGQIEESAGLDSSLSECLEEEFESRDDFVFTGEEIVSVFELVSGVEWVDDDEFLDEQEAAIGSDDAGDGDADDAAEAEEEEAPESDD